MARQDSPDTTRDALRGAHASKALTGLPQLRAVLAGRYGGSSTDERLNRVFLRPTHERLGV